MAPVALEEGVSSEQPAQDRDRRVGQWNRDDQRRRDPHRPARRTVRRERGESREHRSHEVGAAVAEVHPCGRGVEHEERSEGAGEGQAHGRRVAIEDREGRRAHDADPGREPVLAVEQVHRVEEGDDEHRGGDPHRGRARDGQCRDHADEDLGTEA